MPRKTPPASRNRSGNENAPHRGVFSFWFTSCAEKQKDKFRLLASGFEKKVAVFEKKSYLCLLSRARRARMSSIINLILTI